MANKKNILITGANGQLGMEFRDLERDFPAFNFLFVSKEELSISDLAAVQQYFARHELHYCINCAAYTAVDRAETERGEAMQINAVAVGNLAAVSAAHKCCFIHFSTDYVFNGKALQPYKETDPTSPVNFYGVTKLEGEKAALANNPDSIIIRTSWVYSRHGKNFVKTMQRLMIDKPSISVVDDQLGCPTYAADLAHAVMQIISHDKKVPGIYHYSNSGVISWFEFASEIKKFVHSDCVVNPIPTSSYPTPAARPSYSAFDSSRIQKVYGVERRTWQASLRRMLSAE